MHLSGYTLNLFLSLHLYLRRYCIVVKPNQNEDMEPRDYVLEMVSENCTRLFVEPMLWAFAFVLNELSPSLFFSLKNFS